jgi:hypothetical protein
VRPSEIIVIGVLLWLLFGAAAGSQDIIEERIDPCVRTQTCP